MKIRDGPNDSALLLQIKENGATAGRQRRKAAIFDAPDIK